MGIFDFLKDNGVNKDIEKRIKINKAREKSKTLFPYIL